MGSRRVVVEISSDEEGDGDGDGDGDNFDCISKMLLNEQTDESDDVVILLNPKQMFESSIGAVVKPLVKYLDDDDECVILDGDPDKPVDIKNDGINESDDLLVVGEKGQVACRDYPHPRYLCANFPFSSTPHERHCDLCHCYICDSLAPCLHWGMGISFTDHCNATDKDALWKLLRKSWKIKDKAPLSVRPPQINQVPQFSPPVPNCISHNPVRPTPIRATSISPPLGIPNIINQHRNQRSGCTVPKKKNQPYLVTRKLLGKCNNVITKDKRHNVGNLGPRFISPRVPLKRTGPVGVPLQTNLCEYSSSNRNHLSQYSKNPQPVATQPYAGPIFSVPSQPQVHSQHLGDSNSKCS